MWMGWNKKAKSQAPLPSLIYLHPAMVQAPWLGLNPRPNLGKSNDKVCFQKDVSFKFSTALHFLERNKQKFGDGVLLGSSNLSETDNHPASASQTWGLIVGVCLCTWLRLFLFMKNFMNTASGCNPHMCVHSQRPGSHLSSSGFHHHFPSYFSWLHQESESDYPENIQNVFSLQFVHYKVLSKGVLPKGATLQAVQFPCHLAQPSPALKYPSWNYWSLF